MTVREDAVERLNAIEAANEQGAAQYKLDLLHVCAVRNGLDSQLDATD